MFVFPHRSKDKTLTYVQRYEALKEENANVFTYMMFERIKDHIEDFLEGKAIDTIFIDFKLYETFKERVDLGESVTMRLMYELLKQGVRIEFVKTGELKIKFV